MPDLIAQGPEPEFRWRRALPDGQPIVLGRAATGWSATWDPHISRQHARLECRGESLRVTRLAAAANPIYFRGQQMAECELRPGDHFAIGATTFTFAATRASVSLDAPQPARQQAFSSQYLRQVTFRDPDHRIEVLTRLPEAFSGAGDDVELFVRLVSLLLAGIPRADAAAVVGTIEPIAEGSEAQFAVLHWDQRLAIARDLRPSQGLIQESMRLRQSVLHVWRGMGREPEPCFTESENVDWAFCTPVPGLPGPGWCLYLTGRFGVDLPMALSSSDPEDLREDVKFAELVAGTLASVRRMRTLERSQAALSQFFSPVVLDTLANEDPEVVLAPRETTVSVVFCDLRGFTRKTERQADDLMGLLERVSKALGVMTHHIRRQGGVVGDFHGDAAMGFWGWPVAQDDAILRTARAALDAEAELSAQARQPESPLAGFQAGIGIATGRAVAGKIGTVDQVKVTVFGPAVNLASRLEGMTKILRASILLDETTARAVRRFVPRDVARVRRVAVVRPYGLDKPLEVSQLLPPASQFPDLTDEHIACYESALDHYLAGRWSKAFELLHQIPASDRVKDVLTVFIAQHNRTPPTGWTGIIPLETKF